MERLVIKHSPFIVVRKALGVITILCAISMLISKAGSIRFFDWIFFVSFIISGGSLLTNGFGSEKSYLQPGDGYLKIKWMNRFRPSIIMDAEIEKIKITRFKVIIFRKKRKANNFNLDFLERDQKKEVYEFLIEYAEQKDLELVREF
jgi:hypothetical protein